MRADPSHPSLAHTDHRPWPLPDGRWSWRQSWIDLLFAHWPVPVEALRPFVHPDLAIQEFEGTSWIGVVPFRMAGVTPRSVPEIPGVSAFPEINVRVYVEHSGKAGVWFFSLDASNLIAVSGARVLYGLPYYLAEMGVTVEGEDVHYESERRSSPPLQFEADYTPISEPYSAASGTLEHWLTERYCLYGSRAGRGLYRIDVHHAQWPLQRARADIRVNDMGRPFGLALDEPPATLHFSSHLDVVIWPPERIA